MSSSCQAPKGIVMNLALHWLMIIFLSTSITKPQSVLPMVTAMLLLYNQQLLCLNITVQNCIYQESFKESCLFWLMMCNKTYIYIRVFVCVCIYISNNYSPKNPTLKSKFAELSKNINKHKR